MSKVYIQVIFTILFLKSIADVLNLLMNDNGFIKYQQLSRAEALLIVPLTFTGMVIVNGILSTLQSYVTRPIIQPQINTIEDIFNSPFPILTPSRHWASELPVLLKNMSRHADWTDKVHLQNNSEMLLQIFTYNTSISVLLYQSHAKILLEHQKRINIRGYYIPTQIYIQKFLSSYHVSDDFPFIDRFNEIIHRVKCAGLYTKWIDELYNEVKENAFSRNRSDYEGKSSQEIDVEVFPVPVFIAYGWGAGIIMLVFEIIWKKMNVSSRLRAL